MADQPRGVTVFVCIGCRMSSLTSTYPCSESALGAWGWADGLCPACRPDSPLEVAGRVRRIHQSCELASIEEGGCPAGASGLPADHPEICVECCGAWPCATIRALEGSNDG